MRFLVGFGLVALAEMATFFWVESIIGIGWALGLAVATAVIGSMLVRRAGLSVIGRIQARTRRGEIPGRELSDGAAVLVAGALLISPGFLTDLIGFLLLVPAVRAFVYRRVTARYASRFTVLRGPNLSGPGVDTSADVIDLDPEDYE